MVERPNSQTGALTAWGSRQWEVVTSAVRPRLRGSAFPPSELCALFFPQTALYVITIRVFGPVTSQVVGETKANI